MVFPSSRKILRKLSHLLRARQIYPAAFTWGHSFSWNLSYWEDVEDQWASLFSCSSLSPYLISDGRQSSEHVGRLQASDLKKDKQVNRNMELLQQKFSDFSRGKKKHKRFIYFFYWHRRCGFLSLPFLVKCLFKEECFSQVIFLGWIILQIICVLTPFTWADRLKALMFRSK